jgi:hypothetical protein
MSTSSNNSDDLQAAIASADIYHNVGTTFLHINNPLEGNGEWGCDDASNPTGAVVPSISMATTFRQATPGEPTARGDPNSFGLGFEYSRTGRFGCFNLNKPFACSLQYSNQRICYHQ